MAGLLPTAADVLSGTVTLAAEEYQDQAAEARQGPFVSFDWEGAHWRAQLERSFLSSELAALLLGGDIDPDALPGEPFGVEFSASYFDDAAGASAAMGIFQAASLATLVDPGASGTPSALSEVRLTVGDAARAVVFFNSNGDLALPLAVWTEVVVFQRGRVLASVVVFAFNPAEVVAADLSRVFDTRIREALALLPPGEPEPVDAEQEAARRALAAAEARWRDAGLSAYSFRFVRYCECDESFGGPFDVRVVDERVLDFRRAGVQADLANATTISELFVQIAAAIERGVAVIVTYDPQFGYPLEVQLDLDAIAVDGGLALEVLSFDPS